MKRIIGGVLAVVLTAAILVPMAVAQAAGQEASIRKVMDAQVAAWNRHDLDGFMVGYWNSPELTFYSGGTITRGWQGAIDRYKKSYQAPGKEMGKLEFQDLQVEVLGPKSAFVRGKFLLTMSDGKQPHGLFTLIFQQFPEGWRIIHDHSSSGD
jgi:beta-aspartyl-peptidase (threonine type)